MSKLPSDDTLEILYKLRTCESGQLFSGGMHDMEIRQKITMPTHPKLKTMMKRRKDQKLRLRNFEARHGRIETGAVIKNRKGMSGVDEKKVPVISGKKNSVCKETDVVSGKRVTIVQKKQTTVPPHLMCHPCHDVEEMKYPMQK